LESLAYAKIRLSILDDEKSSVKRLNASFLLLLCCCCYLYLSAESCVCPNCSTSLLVVLAPKGPRRTRLLAALLPIAPAARRTVSSTIKGCVVMKGALAEAIYFPAQRRKVFPPLIFQCRLCVPYLVIMCVCGGGGGGPPPPKKGGGV